MSRHLIESLKRFPPVTWVLKSLYERRVRTSGNWWFWGAFESYEAAVRQAPAHPQKAIGYNQAGVASLGSPNYAKLHLFDYPALYWIRRFVAQAGAAPRITLVDLGGHIGEKYHAYAPYWTSLPALSWVVCETPSAVREAHVIDPNPPGALTFTSDRSVIDGADVLFASGSLQYLDWAFWDVLESFQVPPRFVVINKLPLWDGPEIWSLQNAGHSIVPYQFFNRDRFLQRCTRFRYEILDTWLAREASVKIPFHVDLPAARIEGLALSLTVGQ